jgi:hypothetical protein
LENGIGLTELLIQLKLAVFSTSFSKKKALSALEALLLWLNEPENNNHNNCRHVDYYVANEICDEPRFKALPDELREILFDLGATLHDTHTSPHIAENFESTPRQLLERLRKLL